MSLLEQKTAFAWSFMLEELKTSVVTGLAVRQRLPSACAHLDIPAHRNRRARHASTSPPSPPLLAPQKPPFHSLPSPPRHAAAMGASSSTGNPSPESHELREQEALASASLSLPILRASFSHTSPLPETLSLPPATFISLYPPAPPHFHDLLSRLGPIIASLFFHDAADGWVGFLKGFNRCCARMPASQSLALLLRVYSAACTDAGAACGLQFHPDEDGGGGEGGKVVGELASEEIAVFLWMCWIMATSGWTARVSGGEEGKGVAVQLPEVTHLVLSALVSAGAVADDAGVWAWEVSGAGKGVTVQQFTSWALSTAAELGNSLSRYVQERIRSCTAAPAEKDTSVSTGNTPLCASDVYLLTPGRAWAISLSLRNSLSEKFLASSVIGMDTEDLLYRSSVHGKGLSRFWSCVEGYNGPILILLSAYSNGGDDDENVGADRRWVIGVLTEEGFENKDTFYGSSGFLCATFPIFRMLPPSGKEKNFIYCHMHSPIRVYEAKPKPVGLAFGGTMGNERIFLDEDFSKVTVRHHAVDKTYKHGSLIPNQGFLPVEAPILDVDAWGLGGERTRHQQNVYKRREDLFSEQRRKIDLKTFANWEDSPEKMMMDMVSDPNKVRREDR